MMYLRHGTEIVGYAFDASLWCLDCAGDHIPTAVAPNGDVSHPIFAMDLTSDDTCDSCLTRIEDTL